MAEQNAHDDERDTADLVAGGATDLAIDDATDLAVADTARPQAPAEQLTPAGSAVSPSSSPTPTFAATDRPARRARRLRWKPGITRPMMALSAASFALMVAGVGGYVSAIPAVVAGDKPGAVVIPLESALWLDGQMREVQAGPANSTRAVGPLTVEGSKTDAAAPDAAAALGIGSSSGMLGVASLTGASAASSVASASVSVVVDSDVVSLVSPQPVRSVAVMAADNINTTSFFFMLNPPVLRYEYINE